MWNRFFFPAFGLTALMLSATQAQTPSTIVSDFETKTAGSWWCFTDKTDSGASVITTADSLLYWDSTAIVGGANGSEGAIKLGFQFGNKNPICGSGCSYPPQVGMGISMPTDITGATGVSFWAKADAPMKISFAVSTSDITDNGNFLHSVSLTSDWTKYTLNFSDLTQPSWAKHVTFDPANFKSISYTISKGDNAGVATGALYLDNVVIEGWAYAIDPEGLVHAASKLNGMRVYGSGSNLRVTLSTTDSQRPGILTAADSQGKILGRAAFGMGASEVKLNLESHNPHAPVFLKVTSR